MKKFQYINIVFILMMVFIGGFVSAEDSIDSTSTFDSPQDRAIRERSMVKDRIEEEKIMRMKLEDGRQKQMLRERVNYSVLDRLKQDRLLEKDRMIENKEKTREQIQEKRELMREKSDDRMEKLEGRRDDRAEAWKSKAIERLHAGFSRLATLIERLESRIVKIDEAGGNTLRAKASIQNATDKINLAKDKIEEIRIIEADENSNIEEDISLEQNTLVQKALPVAREVQQLLKGAHQDLVDAVKFLKTDNQKETLETDSSPSTNDVGSDENEQNQ